MTRQMTRGTGLVGTLVIGALVAAVATPAHADGLDYATPEAFAVAQDAYLELEASNNETGLYAWGESYFLLGLLRMYEAHGDTRYLDTFESRADHLLSTTDRAREVTDYRGVSGPVWRAAGNYTASHGTVTNAEGRPLVQLRWAGTRGAETTAEITEAAGGTFDLELRNPAITNAVTLTGVSLDPDSESYIVDAVNAAYTTSTRWTAEELRSAPGAEPAPPPGTIPFESQYYVFPVHTGMIVYPLAKYARMMIEAPGQHPTRQAQALRLLDAVGEAIDFHADEFVIGPDGVGDYIWPKGAPVPFDGTVQPYNQTHGLGQAMAEMHRITGGYGDEMRAMVQGLRNGLTLEDGAYVWSYWPLHSELYNGYTAASDVSTYTPSYSASRQFEDISHAAITLEFVHAAYEAGVDDGLLTDIERFTRTFTGNVVRSDTEVWQRVNGTVEAVPANAVQSARWMPYARYDDLVYEQSLRVYEAVELVPSQGSHALGIAYLNWARNRAWEDNQ